VHSQSNRDKRLSPEEYLAIVHAEPARADATPPTSGTEAYIRAQSARDARRTSRNMWLFIGLVVLVLIGVALSRPSSVHCIGSDYQASCTDTRTGSEWP